MFGVATIFQFESKNCHWFIDELIRNNMIIRSILTNQNQIVFDQFVIWNESNNDRPLIASILSARILIRLTEC